MSEHQPEPALVHSEMGPLSGVRRFRHPAMGTTFEILICQDDAQYARQAADAAFDLLERLEAQLSRFVENSDVARINNLPAGTPLLLGLDAYECLRVSQRMYNQTGGAFDVTIGFLWEYWLNEDKSLRNPTGDEIEFARRHTGMGLVRLDETRFAVELLTSPLRVDLGGIGKGYATDKMGELLNEWGIHRALIHGGFSSVLALEAPEGMKGWPITLSHPQDRSQVLRRIDLWASSVSGSGVEKGFHIIDPRTAGPARGKIAAWSLAPSGAVADALSTAFMVMSEREIERYCAEHDGVAAEVVTTGEPMEGAGDRIVSFGAWA